MVEEELFDCFLQTPEGLRVYWKWEMPSKARFVFWSPPLSRNTRVFLIDVAVGSERSTMRRFPALRRPGSHYVHIRYVTLRYVMLDYILVCKLNQIWILYVRGDKRLGAPKAQNPSLQLST